MTTNNRSIQNISDIISDEFREAQKLHEHKRNMDNTWEQRRLKHEYELGIAHGREVTKEERKQIKAHLAIQRAVQTGDKEDMLNALQSLGQFIHDPRTFLFKEGGRGS